MAIYAVSDLHGCLNLLHQIQSYIKKEDKVYVLGDCGDRGPEPWLTIKEVAKDNRFIYLKGNHEDMLVKSLIDYKRDGYINSHNFSMLFRNGGRETFFSLLEEENANDWAAYLKNLPIIATYINKNKTKIYLCHAGFTPHKNIKLSENDLIWDRDHYFDLVTDWENCIVIHGHTPIKYICYDLGLMIPNGALWYANNKKVCLDCGSYNSNKTVLLNLDTFKEIVFKEIKSTK